jgi:hypothetical protein
MNKFFSLTIAVSFICACAPTRHQGMREISKASPASRDAQYNLELTDVGIAMTLPNGHWLSDTMKESPGIKLWRPDRNLEIRVQVCNVDRVNGLNGYIKQQRKLIMEGHAGSYVRVDTLTDEFEGRKGFEMKIPGPNRTTRIVKMIFAPMPGRIDQIIAIFISGDEDDYRYLKIATRYIVESIRPIGATSALITVPGTGPGD